MEAIKAVKFPKGAAVLILEDRAEYFYIIQSGYILVEPPVGSSTTEKIKKGPGDFIGVISCMSGRNQVESAIAATDVVAIAVKRSQFESLIKLSTPTAIKIIRTFSKNMKVLNEVLMMQTTAKKTVDDPRRIFEVARYYEKEELYDIAVFAYGTYTQLGIQDENRAYAAKKFKELMPKARSIDLKSFSPSDKPSRSYKKGTMIFSEFQSGYEMYIIKKGSVKITKILEGTEVTLAILNEGAMFGEMALLNHDLRSASAIAMTDCDLSIINKKTFEVIKDTNPTMITNLTTTFAERLWIMQRQLFNSQIRDDLYEKMLDMLALQLEKMGRTQKENYLTDFLPKDIANMCGLAELEQARTLPKFEKSPFIKVDIKNRMKVFVLNCEQLIDHARSYRERILKKQKR